MLQRLRTFLKHRWLDESDTRRAIPPEALERLTRLVAASEALHGGEIRILVEASLPTSYLWRHLVDGTSIAALTRQRAVMMFARLRVWDTQRNNGILLYLLLAERKIELVADRGINAVVSGGEWDGMVQRMALAFAAGRFEAGLAQAVEEVTVPLKRHFVLAPGVSDQDELPDTPNLA